MRVGLSISKLPNSHPFQQYCQYLQQCDGHTELWRIHSVDVKDLQSLALHYVFINIHNIASEARVVATALLGCTKRLLYAICTRRLCG